MSLQIAQKEEAITKLKRDSKGVIKSKKDAQKLERKNIETQHKAEVKALKKVPFPVGCDGVIF